MNKPAKNRRERNLCGAPAMACMLDKQDFHRISQSSRRSQFVESNDRALETLMQQICKLVVSMTSLMVPSSILHFHVRSIPGMIGLSTYLYRNHAFFLFRTIKWIKHALLICLLAALSGLLIPSTLRAQSGGNNSGRVSLDFNDVELSVFVRFISELTGKNFVLDEVVKKAGGKISVYSPTKVTPDQAYSMFVAALEVSRLAVITKGNVHQIVAMGELPPERGAYVYKLKNANATDLAAILTNLVARSQTVVQTTPGTRPLFRPLSEFEAPVQVFADKATNSIVISSTKSAYTKLLSVMRDLDTRRNNVFVEAVILEVQVTRLKQIGSDPLQVIGAGKSGSLAGIASLNTAPENLATIAQAITGTAAGAATGGVAVLNTVNVRAFLQLLLSLTDTNVLSTPQVLAADNQKAKIVVGENRPFPTGQAQGITGGTLVTIERKDVGVTLEITPQVMENDLIRLEIKQERQRSRRMSHKRLGAALPASQSDPPRLNGPWRRPPSQKINRRSLSAGSCAITSPSTRERSRS